MPIRQVTPKSAINAYFNKRLQMVKSAMIESLAYVGEEALKQARTRHRYKDQTGNLTSSIGYCILDNGRVVFESDFASVLNGKEGSREGRDYLRKLISENSSGLVFIMVAGMPYAQYVEAMNLDVLESAEMLAKRMLPQILKRLKLD